MTSDDLLLCLVDWEPGGAVDLRKELTLSALGRPLHLEGVALDRRSEPDTSLPISSLSSRNAAAAGSSAPCTRPFGIEGMSQGVLSAVMSDVAPAARPGTAYGLFYLCTGLGSLVASVAAGFVWDMAGAPATFMVVAILAICALLALGWTRRNFMPAPARNEDPGKV